MCPGDCNADGTIDDGDVRLVVVSIFAPEPAAVCPHLVVEGATPVVVDAMSAMARSGGECVPPQAPVIPPHAAYRSYAGYEIALPIAADSARGPLLYSAQDLPDGAVLEADTGILRWTPSEQQIGAYVIPFRVTDHGLPPLSAEGRLGLRITRLDSCSIPSCDPATGCTSTMPPLSEPCCAPGPVERVPEVYVDCPGGKFLMVGQNTNDTFGRLQNCDKLKFIAFTQSGVTIRIHLGARCVRPKEVLSVHTFLEVEGMALTDAENTIIMNATDAGFVQRVAYTPDVRGAMMEMNGKEANLTMTVADLGTGVVVSETLRLVITHSDLDDLPDIY